MRHLSSWVPGLVVRYLLVGVVVIVMNAMDTQRTVVLYNRAVRLFGKINHIHPRPLLVVVVMRTLSPLGLSLRWGRLSCIKLAIPNHFD